MAMSSMKLNNSEKGASAIEFAVILPLLLLLVFGIIEFGIILYNQAVLTNACREGARYGIVSRTPRFTELEIKTITENYCKDNFITFESPPTPPDVTVTKPATPTFGDDLTVRATYGYRFLLIPSFVPGLPNTLQLKTQALMKYE
jgi:Flp pilus assembly protein TadG